MPIEPAINLSMLLTELTELIAGFKGTLSCDQTNRMYGILGVLEDDNAMSYDESLWIIKTLNELNWSRLPEALQRRIDALLNKRATSVARIKLGEMLG